MEIYQLTELVCKFAEDTAKENGMKPIEVIGALLTGGVAIAFTYADEKADRYDVASDIVGLVNSTCTSIIKGLENEKETASNG
jgi:hypothetical protein